MLCSFLIETYTLRLEGPPIGLIFSASESISRVQALLTYTIGAFEIHLDAPPSVPPLPPFRQQSIINIAPIASPGALSRLIALIIRASEVVSSAHRQHKTRRRPVNATIASTNSSTKASANRAKFSVPSTPSSNTSNPLFPPYLQHLFQKNGHPNPPHRPPPLPHQTLHRVFLLHRLTFPNRGPKLRRAR